MLFFEAIKDETPDVAIIDAAMPNLDAVELMKKVNKGGYKAPLFIVTSSYDNPFIERTGYGKRSGLLYFKAI